MAKALVLIGFVFSIHWLLLFFSIRIANATIGAIGFSTYGVHLIVLGWLLDRGQFTFAMPLFLCCLPWAHWEFQPGDWLMILYLGLGLALVGHGLWVHAVTVLSTTTTSILSYLFLPLSLIMSYLLLSEKMAGRALLGVGLVLIANALVLISQVRRGTLKS